jgi:uncharacterized membrane protein YfcA
MEPARVRGFGGMIQDLLAAASGSLVGLALGLVGGGGSILAVPLLVYVVGVREPHVAIGTSAAAVAANALLGLGAHARHGGLKWRCAAVFAAAGVLGALAGAWFGQRVEGERLLALFAALMVVVGVLMLRRRSADGDPDVRLGARNAPRLAAAGVGAGALSGFFGIGGGFLIVPSLVWATGMPLLSAMAASLVGVAAFGLTTSASYAFAGLVDWRIAALFVAGGLAGVTSGARAARRLGRTRGALNLMFAALIFVVAGYMLVRSLAAA